MKHNCMGSQSDSIVINTVFKYYIWKALLSALTLSYHHNWAELFVSIEHRNCLWDTFCQVCVKDEVYFHYCMQYMGLWVISWPISFLWLPEYQYFISLSPSNHEFDSLAIVKCSVMNKWYVLYVSLYSYTETYQWRYHILQVSHHHIV